MPRREVRRNLVGNSNVTISIDGYELRTSDDPLVANPGVGTISHYPNGGINDSESLGLDVTTGGDFLLAVPAVFLTHGDRWTASANITLATGAGTAAQVVPGVIRRDTPIGTETLVSGAATDLTSPLRPSHTFTFDDVNPDGNPAATAQFALLLTGVEAGATIRFDDFMVEPTDAVDRYFDGDPGNDAEQEQNDPDQFNRWIYANGLKESVLERNYEVKTIPNSGYLIIGRVRTGQITVRAGLPTGVDVELPLNEPGVMQINSSLPWVDPLTGVPIDLSSEAVPWRDFIGWVENDEILFAGPVTADSFFAPDSIKITATDPWGYLNRRNLFKEFPNNPIPYDMLGLNAPYGDVPFGDGLGSLTRLSWAISSYETIGRNIVRLATRYSIPSMPIDVQYETISGTHSRPYSPEDMPSPGGALSELTTVTDGVDFKFRPKWTADRRGIRWELVPGTPELKQEGAPHYWDTSVPSPHATIKQINRTGETLASLVYFTGDAVTNMLDNPELMHGCDGGIDGWVGRGPSAVVGQADGEDLGYAALTGPDGSEAVHEYPVYVNSGEQYVLSVSIKAEAGSLNLEWLNDEGLILGTSTLDWDGASGTDYEVVTLEATAPLDAVSARPVLAPPPTGGPYDFTFTEPRMYEGVAESMSYSSDVLDVRALAYNRTLIDEGYPLLEKELRRGTETSETSAASHANESAARSSKNIETVSFSVARDQHPPLGSYWPGDYVRVKVGSHPRYPKGVHMMRIIRIQFGGTGNVTVECAPQVEAGGYTVPPSDKTWLKTKIRDIESAIQATGR